jgi:hypothetical protein
MILPGTNLIFTKHALKRVLERSMGFPLCKNIINYGKKELKYKNNGIIQTIYWHGNYKIAIDYSTNTIVTVMKCKKHATLGYKKQRRR